MLNIKEPNSVHMVRGTILHKVIENFYNTENLLADIGDWHWDAKKFFAEMVRILDEEWAKIGAEYEDIFTNKEQKDEFYHETKDFLDFHSTKLAFALHKKKSELDPDSRWYETEIKKHFFPKDREAFIENDEIMGYIDKVINLYGNGVAIIDFKTSKSGLPSFIDEGHLLQLKAYAYLWNLKHGQVPKFVGIEYMRSGNTIFYPITKQDLDEVDKLITKLKEARDTNNFLVNRQRLCDWCYYKDRCLKLTEQERHKEEDSNGMESLVSPSEIKGE